MHIRVESFLKDFRLSLEKLGDISSRLTQDMIKGLDRHSHHKAPVKMLPTFVRATPDGTEEGDFLALDLGGTNFRVLHVRVQQDQKKVLKMDSEICAIPQELMTGPGEQLFDHIVACLGTFLENQGLKDQVLPLGFTFSFPCEQKEIDKSILIRWTKGFNCSGVEGRDVVQLLKEAIQRRGDFEIGSVAMVNDTVGTMMSCGYKDKNCEIAMIIGTGTNACYMEEMCNVKRVEGEGGQMCINTEWGGFGDDGALRDIQTEFDLEVDRSSINPGVHIFEKMISGMYLGEIVRLLLVRMTEDKLLFNGKTSERLKTKDAFQTKFISEIEAFSAELQAVVRDLAPRCSLDFSVSEDGSGKGAAMVTAVAQRIAAQSHLIDDSDEDVESFLKDFRLSLEKLGDISSRLTQDMIKGLDRHSHHKAPVKMLPTFVRATPDGTEEGDFLALDLGGTNFRVLHVRVQQDQKKVLKMDSEICAIPQELMTGPENRYDSNKLTLKHKTLFDHIVACLGTFLENQGLKDQVLPLGFTFSFPCEQKEIDKSILIRWTKGFNCSGVEGRDVVQLLKEAIQRRGDFEIGSVAMVNDTVGTMMSCGYKDKSCEIAMIIGQMCINTEWGGFGDDGALRDIQTEFDLEVDRSSINPGLEKMISGMYLGEIVRLLLVRMTEDKLLFNGKASERLKTKDAFQTKFISEIEAEGSGEENTRRILSDLGLRFSPVDLRAVRLVCDTVSSRSARLCAAALAAIANKIRTNRGLDQLRTTVAVDGTVFKNIPSETKTHFSAELQSVVRDLAPLCSLDFSVSEDGSGKGAAMVTAVAQRIAASRT
ncbi:hypothetical protein WMY93_007324 [Mugilogobius chulae]|uniref:hexokinase n=1 Tax=Mugilogobius chulae TaxID=88201 RepID=A0AAW0PJ65_9GOBI